MKKSSNGFTLAEVLITLGIIGVVAALTIPTLVNNSNESEYNTGVKKIYSSLSSAVSILNVNTGGTIRVGTDNTDAGHETFMEDFCSVMNCTSKGTGGEIFTAAYTYSWYKSTSWGTMSSGAKDSAILNDGTLLKFSSFNNCTTWGVNACGYIWADINGHKKPDMLGKDMYMFFVCLNNGTYSVLPTGTQASPWPADTDCVAGSNHGRGCTVLRLLTPEKMQ